MREKVTIQKLRDKALSGEKITMMTAYDYPLARLEEKAGMDVILCGDSVNMTVYGYDNTLNIGMDVMVRHAQAVRRGAPAAFLVGDMPYMSYQVSPEEAIRNASRFMAEAGCDAVKIEGGAEVAETAAAMVKATIPVMGHLGLTPQSIAQLGGFKSQGRDLAAAQKIIDDTAALTAAGVSLMVLEAVPPEVGCLVAERAGIPVIGIGAGPHVHGQLLIVHDALGFYSPFVPKFVKQFADLDAIISEALARYVREVRGGVYPAEEHCYQAKTGETEKILREI
ncbi:MAG: 3-methyl-2-oxobutanoate hydroxymethyltransferase [Gracilibacteraceae bacterium]|jgi:3-methyl-2-oxobutanoate hydroxymethyltransferase|nr:3-methyl-2-oxobutanoate hydroxymethyltransferase [Gracilibacteraceae bacterium]